MKFKVLSIDAWADTQSCPHCGYNKISDTTKSNLLKCDSCLEYFEDHEGISWTWNNWWEIESSYNDNIHGILNEENAIKFFNEIVSFDGELSIEDDQYNLVLTNKKNGKPLYAIQYGSDL